MERQTNAAASDAAKGRASPGQARPPPDPRDLPPVDAVKTAFQSIGELREYARYFLAAKLDGIKLSLRTTGIRAALGLIGLLALGALVVTSVVLACTGVAQLLALAFGGRAWAGNLVAGLLLLFLLGGGVVMGMKYLAGSLRRRTVRKYELRRTRQRADLGHDVAQRARESQRR